MSQSSQAESAAAKSSLLRNSAIMAAGTLLSRVLGFVKGAVLTLAIGTAVAGNAFNAGNSLPNQLYILIVGGALNAILVPQIVKASKAPDGGRDFINRLITLAIVAFAGLTVVCLALYVPLFDIFAANNSGVTRELGLIFALWCVPQIFFYCIFTLLGHMLNARESFGPYTWAPVVNNVVAIIGAIVFIVMFGSHNGNTNTLAFWNGAPMIVLAGSTTLGVVMQAMILIPSLRKVGINYRWQWGFRGMGLGQVGKIGGWTIGAIALGQVAVLSFTVALGAANTASAAYVAAHSDASNSIVGGFGFNMIGYVIFMLPQSLIVVSLVTAIFPRMSRAAVDQNIPEFRAHFSQSMRAYVPIMLFSVGALIALAEPVVSLATFGESRPQTQAIAVVTQILLLGVPGFAAIFVIKRAFYAFEDGRTPFVLQIPVTVISWIVVGIALATAPGAQMAIWAAWASTIANTLTVIVGLWLLKRRIGDLDGARISQTYGRSIIVMAIVTLIGWALAQLLDGMTFASIGGAFAVTAIVGTIMLFLFLLLCVVLRIEELQDILMPILRRLKLARFVPARFVVAPAAAMASGAAESADAAAASEIKPAESVNASAHNASGVFTKSKYDRSFTEQSGGAAASNRAGTTPQNSNEVYMSKNSEHTDALSGRYRMGKQLHSSAAGALYSGIDTTLDKPVNVQIVKGSHHAGAVREAALRMVAFNNPSFSQVLSVDMDGEDAIIVQSATSQYSLTELVKNGPLPVATVRAIIGLSAEALEVAARRGFFHGALTSDHIMVGTDGNIHLRGLGFEAAQFGLNTRDPGQWARRDAVALMQAFYVGITSHCPVRFGAEERIGVTPNEGLTPHVDLPLAPYHDGEIVSATLVPRAASHIPPKIDEALTLIVNSPTDSGEGVRDMHDVIELLRPWERPKDSIPVPRPANARIINGQVIAAESLTTATYDDGPHAKGVVDAEALARANRAFTDKPATELAVVEAEYVPVVSKKDRVRAAGGGAVAAGAAVMGAFKAPRERIVGPASAGLGTVLQVALDKGGQHEPPEQVFVRGRLFNASKFTMIIVAIGVAVALVASVAQIMPVFTTSFGALRSGAAKASSAAAPKTGGIPTQAPTTAAPAPSAASTPPKIVGATTFSDLGPEKQEQVGAIFDGKPETVWTTNTYRSQEFGGLKPNVGVGLSLEANTTVKKVTIFFDGNGGHVQLLPGKENRTAPGQAPILAEGDLQGGTLVLNVPENTVVDGVTVVLTSLSGSGTNWRVAIKEITIE